MSAEKGKVEELNEQLYSRTSYRGIEDVRRPVGAADEPATVGEDWQSPDLDRLLTYERTRNQNHPIMRKVFIFALGFFVLAVGAAIYSALGGSNFISSKNVDITVRGPVSISAGNVLELEVTVLNRNNADLGTVALTLQYPEGTRDADDTNKPLQFHKEDLGALGAGKEVSQTERAVIYGEKGEVKTVKVGVDYTLKGSSATFSKSKTLEIGIGSIPVTMTVDRPDSVTSGDEFRTTITLVSNSPAVLKNVLVKAEYPYGFSLTDSDPDSTADAGNIWNLGDIPPGAKRTIVLRGRLLGEDTEERTFRFYAGIGSGDEPTDLDTTLATSLETMSISRPSLDLKTSLNGETDDPYIAPLGKSVQASVRLENNAPSTLLNNRVEVRLSGDTLDKSSVRVSNGGFYNSQTNTVSWEPSAETGLVSIGPGDGVSLSFSFASVSTLPSGAKNPEISLATFARGIPQGEGSSGALSVSGSRKVRLASLVMLTAKGFYAKGPLKNTGPLPPKVDKETTYTIVLDAGNTQNDISNAVVTARLGQAVTWIKAYSTDSESIKYDETSNTVTWTIGTLASGAGFSTKPREAVFQVSLTPSLSQVGTTPTLVSSIMFSGTDSFTMQPSTLSAGSVTTLIRQDPAFIQGDETVVK